MSNKNQKEEISDEKVFCKIKELVEETPFGSVTLIIQDGRVIQIESQKKIRLV